MYVCVAAVVVVVVGVLIPDIKYILIVGHSQKGLKNNGLENNLRKKLTRSVS